MSNFISARAQRAYLFVSRVYLRNVGTCWVGDVVHVMRGERDGGGGGAAVSSVCLLLGCTYKKKKSDVFVGVFMSFMGADEGVGEIFYCPRALAL